VKAPRHLVIPLHSDEINVDAETHDGTTPLISAAAGLPGSLECIKLLLEKGADVDKCDNDVMSPICFAASKAHLKAVQWFRRSSTSADNCLLRRSVKSGRCALEMCIGAEASEDDILQTLAYMLKHVTKPDWKEKICQEYEPNARTAAMAISLVFGLALRLGLNKVVDFLFTSFDEKSLVLHCRDVYCGTEGPQLDKRSPLAMIMSRKTFDLALAEKLLDLGADTHASIPPPLHIALQGRSVNHLRMAEELLPLASFQYLNFNSLLFTNWGCMLQKEVNTIFHDEDEEVLEDEECERPIIFALRSLMPANLKLLLEMGDEMGMPCVRKFERDFLFPKIFSCSRQCQLLYQTPISAISWSAFEIREGIHEDIAQLADMMLILLDRGHEVNFADPRVASPLVSFMACRGSNMVTFRELPLNRPAPHKPIINKHYPMGYPQNEIMEKVMSAFARAGARVRKCDYPLILAMSPPVKTALAISKRMLEPEDFLSWIMEEIAGEHTISFTKLTPGNLYVLSQCLPDRVSALSEVVANVRGQERSSVGELSQNFLKVFSRPASLSLLAAQAVRRALVKVKRLPDPREELSMPLSVPHPCRDQILLRHLDRRRVEQECVRCGLDIWPFISDFIEESFYWDSDDIAAD